MAVKYALFENHLTSDPDDYMAIVQSQRTRDINDIIDIMIGRGSTVTKAEALSVLEEFNNALSQVLADGDSINLPFFKAKISISGEFANAEAPFDRNIHHLNLKVRPGDVLSKIVKDLAVERVQGLSAVPTLKTFKDVVSDTTNDTLTANGVGELKGSHLKIDTTDADQGVFFIAADGTETAVSTYIRNKPGNLIFMIPTLTSGTYSLVVRSKPKNIKSIRSGTLDASLTVL